MKIVSLIIAEDDQDDRLLIREALNECGFDTKEFDFVENGEELIQMLEVRSTLKTLVILDLNMPKKDGRQTLLDIRSNEKTRHIPVVILTTSQREEDIKFSYNNGANTFFQKPSAFADLVKLCAVIKNYWSDNAEFC